MIMNFWRRKPPEYQALKPAEYQVPKPDLSGMNEYIEMQKLFVEPSNHENLENLEKIAEVKRFNLLREIINPKSCEIKDLQTTNIQKTVAALIDDQAAYYPKDIIEMLAGNEVKKQDAEVKRRFCHDPYSEVLFVLANTYAGLIFVKDDSDKKQKIQNILSESLEKIFAIDQTRVSYANRIKQAEQILLDNTDKMMKLLEISPKDFKKMLAYPPFRIARNDKKYEEDKYTLYYSPTSGKLTEEQIKINQALFDLPQPLPESNPDQPKSTDGSLVSAIPNLTPSEDMRVKLAPKDNFLGIADGTLYEIIKKDVQEQNVDTQSNGSSSGRSYACTSNLTHCYFATKGDYKFKLNTTTHSDWTPTDHKKPKLKKKSEGKKGKSENVENDIVAEITAQNMLQTLKVGFSSMKGHQIEENKPGERRLFITKSLMSPKAISIEIPGVDMKLYTDPEKTMYEMKKKALEKLNDKNYEVISLHLPVNFYRYRGADNTQSYMKLFGYLLDRLPNCKDEIIQKKVTKLQECANNDRKVNSKKMKEINKLLEELIKASHESQQDSALTPKQLISLKAMTEILDRLIGIKKDSSKQKFFMYSALTNVAVAGICDPSMALIDSHCKSGKDRTFQDYIFSMTLMQYVEEKKGAFPDLSSKDDKELFGKIFLDTYRTNIAQRHAAQDNVGCFGLKTVFNLPDFLVEKLKASRQALVGDLLGRGKGPEEWNNLTRKFGSKDEKHKQVSKESNDPSNTGFRRQDGEEIQTASSLEEVGDILNKKDQWLGNEKESVKEQEDYMVQLSSDVEMGSIDKDELDAFFEYKSKRGTWKYSFDELDQFLESLKIIPKVISNLREDKDYVATDFVKIEYDGDANEISMPLGEWYELVETYLNEDQKAALQSINPQPRVSNQNTL